MTQKEKQLLLKDLCARLPYGVKVNVMGWDEEKEEEVLVPVTVYSVNTDGYIYFADNDYDITYCNIDACRLYLRPLSSMTDEERKELKATTCPNGTGYFNEQYLVCPVNHFGEQISFDFMANIIDYLITHHIDYRGLIPMGLALEAPEDMYKTE